MQRCRDVIWREVDGDVVGLDLRSSRYFTLNATAAQLWKLLEHDAEEDELVDALVRDHGVEPDRARTDVGAFLDVMREHGLLAG